MNLARLWFNHADNETEYHKTTLTIMPFTHTQQVKVTTLEDLDALANALARYCTAGTVIGLNGGLGAGKTTLTQALGKALGVTETIASPTFVLIHEYNSGKLPIVHLDFYRLEDNSDSLAGDIIPLIEEGRSLVVAEWTKYAPFFQEYVTIDISFELTPDNERNITIHSFNPLQLPELLVKGTIL